jgi:hypothetical protein
MRPCRSLDLCGDGHNYFGTSEISITGMYSNPDIHVRFTLLSDRVSSFTIAILTVM